MPKGTNLIVRLAQDFNSPTPVAAIVCETLKAAVNQGWGNEKASALLKVLERQSGVTVGGQV